MNRKNVLVVDDDPVVRECLCNLLSDDGFEVHGCEGPASALVLAEQKCFHLIITDYRMPDFTGAVLTRRLRESCPSSLIIGVSSEDREDDFLEAGADAFLLKPFVYDILLDLLK